MNRVSGPVTHIPWRNSRNDQMDPATLREQVSGEVILMQPLHHQDDRISGLVVEPTEERGIEPLLYRLAAGLGRGIGWLLGIVNDDQVAAQTGQGASDRRGVAKPLLNGAQLGFGELGLRRDDA